MTSSPSVDYTALFRRAGLDDRSCAELTKNAKLSAQFASLLSESGLADPSTTIDKAVGFAIYSISTKLNSVNSPIWDSRNVLLRAITDRKLRTSSQIEAAVKYFKKATKFVEGDFVVQCGVGVVVSDENIVKAVKEVMAAKAADVKSEKHKILFKLIVEVNERLKWADSGKVKTEVERQLEAVVGPKGAEDSAGKEKGKDAKESKEKDSDEKSKPKVKESKESKESEISTELKLDAEDLEAISGREIAEARNTEEQLKKHLASTGGKTITRFPPEPNGYLHIGHCKAMNFNFGLARKSDGMCILRFDDTNPEAEKLDYIQSIEENVKWMGHKPWKVTYSSDYFEELYQLAIKLIKKGKAYVCHQTAAEVKSSRENRTTSPWRDRPIEESLRLFEDMRKGKFGEGEATLRMKGDMQADNPQMWDVVAYRVKFSPHPHVGDKWCIYPSYDYSHCIIDSLENITHSCCTLEFEVRRESYYWLLWELDLYKPRVWEYSRLNIEYTVMSKRRLLKLVNDGLVSGWDDPRMPTINGLRRRGYTPEGITTFCNTVGVSRNRNTIPLSLLEHCCRHSLEDIAPRAMVVVSPLKVVLTNWDDSKVEHKEAPNFPKDESKGTHTVPFSKVVYIDESDFKEVDDKDFFGLAPNKEVHLKYAFNIKCTKVHRDSKGKITHLDATVDPTNANKPKGKIHWVAEPRRGESPLAVELRLYTTLFKSPDPMAVDDWVLDLVPLVVKKGFADPTVAKAKPFDKFQFERIGFFSCDPETNGTKDNGLVFNQTVTLKESKPKTEKETLKEKDNSKDKENEKEKSKKDKTPKK